MMNKQEFTYPIYKKRKTTGLVVKFDGLESGVVIEKGVGGTWEIGDVSDSWTVHTHEHWQDWTPPKETKTKTVYEWMYQLKGTNHFEFMKTGRSWEVEV